MSQQEQQFLADYINSDGTLNEANLANALLSSSEFSTKYGSLTNAEFIERMYQNSFGADAPLSDLNNYLTQLNAGTLTRAALATTIADSAEHIAAGNVHAVTNNTAIGSAPITLDHATDVAAATDILRRLYIVGLGRDMSASEIATYSQQIVSGSATEIQIANNILGSSEFASKYGSPSNADFVSLVFFNAYGYLPTSAQAQSWTALLNAGTLSRADFLDAVAESPDRATTAGVNTSVVDVTTTGNVIHVAGLPITFESGSSGTVTSNGSAIAVNSNVTVSVTGTNDPITANGTGNSASVNSGAVSLANSAGVSVSGASDVITLAANDVLSVTGIGHDHSDGLWGRGDGLGFDRRGDGERRLRDGAGEFEPDADGNERRDHACRLRHADDQRLGDGRRRHGFRDGE